MSAGPESLGPRVAQFFEAFLTLSKSHAGQPFIPLEWMREFLTDLFLLTDDGTYLRLLYLLGVPRKNAKSTLAAGAGMFQLIVDRIEPEPEIVIGAGDREQAKIILGMAASMVRSHPDLEAICTVQRNQIINNETGGRFRVVSADAGLAHGLNPSTVIIDEYHVHRTEDLYSALRGGMGMRINPLTLVISTAGHDLDTPLGRLYNQGRKIESGEVVDPTFGFKWFGPGEPGSYDPYDEALWKRCNPSWAIMNHNEFRAASRQMPEADFIRYRLNGWTSVRTAWLPAGAWEGCKDATKALEAGDRVIIGFDGSFSGDATALVACRVDDLYVERVGLWERPSGDEGKGWRVPVAEVEDRIREICEWLTVQEVAADPYFFQVSLQRLEDEGYPIVDFPTNGTRMIPPTKTFFDAVLDQDLSHNGDPALARHVASTRLKQDARGSRIAKEYRASTQYIDLCVAAVIAVGRAREWREVEPARESRLLVL